VNSISFSYFSVVQKVTERPVVFLPHPSKIDLSATKTDTIKTKIEIAYVYDLAHACYKLSAASIIDMLSRANKCKKIMSISMSFDWKHSRVISHVELI